jgi:O-antigen/teichoic acid export membrane protein
MASSIQRDTVYNLGGSLFSIVISLITVPLYLHAIGEARYGVLAIVWLFTGYFGVFDLGMARAAAYHIARQQDAPASARASTFWTAAWLNLGFGLVGGVVLYAIAMPVFAHTFNMPHDLRPEVIASLPWVAASLPLATLSGVLVGTLQARKRFVLVNAIGAVNTTLTQIIPLGVALWHGPDLVWLIPALVLSRAVGLLPLIVGVWRCLPIVPAPLFDRANARSLLAYGGWIAVSNILAPILVTLDRMIIGVLLSAQAVAYYAVPYNLVTRLSILPGALQGSLFPRFASSEPAVGKQLAARGVILLSAVLTIFAVAGIAALPLFLHYWISPDFSRHAAPTGMILVMGVWINGIAYIPYGLLQAQNRPDLTAKFHLIELPPFLLILWAGIHWFGLEGAAMAWTLRNTGDALLLFYATRQLALLRRLVFPVGLMFLALVVAPVNLLSVDTALALGIILLSLIWSMRSAPELRAFLWSKLINRPLLWCLKGKVHEQ